MTRKITILSIILLAMYLVNGQIPSLIYPQKIDSLLLRLKVAEVTDRVDVLNGLALHLAPLYFDSSHQYANEALILAEKLEYEKGKGIALFNIGNSYYYRMDAKNTLANYYEALRILEALEPSQELGNLYIQLAFFTDKANNCRRAIQIFKALGNKKSEEFARKMIPTILNDPLSLDSSYFLGMQNLDYYRKRNDPEGIFWSLYDISNACFYLNKPEGLFFARDALKYAEESRDIWKIVNSYHKIVNFYKNVFNYKGFTTNYDSAKKYLNKSLDILYRSKLPYRHRLIGETYRELGEIQTSLKNYKSAINYFKCGLATIDTFYRCFDTIQFPEPYGRYYHYYLESGDMMITCYDYRIVCVLTGDYKKAYEMRERADSVEHSWTMNMTETQIIAMQAKYEDQKKRDQISLLRQENEIRRLKQYRVIVISSIIGGALLLIFLVAFIWVQRKRFRSERRAMAMEQKLLRSQMNPHFIFNSLAGIQNFIVTEKPMKATTYLSKFSNLVRNILNSSVREYITLEEEISTIENYLELQKIRYAGKFDFTIKTDDAIDPETTMIPPMLAQPFIENAIEHGIVHSDKMGQIDVEFKLENDVILFEVRDNGVGREKAKELEAHLEKDHQSMSTSITLERLAMLNKKRKHKIIFEITDLRDSDGNATGTFVRFGIPLGKD